jgi:Flp pilus assembly protein TadD
MRAVSLCPKVANFWANLGGSYGSLGNYRNSVSVLLEGLSFFPDSEALRKNLGVSYYHMGEYSKAVAILEEIPLESRRREPDISILIDKAKDMLRQGS